MRYLLILLGLAALHPAKAQFSLDGKVADYKSAYIYMQYESNGAVVKDSAAVKNGVFKFTGSIKEPVMAWIRSADFHIYNDSGNVNIYLEPHKMTISLTDGKFGDAVVTGSASQKQYAEMQQQIKQVSKRWRVVMDTLQAVNKRSNFEFQALKNWALTPYHAEIEDIVNNSLRKYPHSYVTANQLAGSAYGMNVDTLKKWYAGFPPNVQQSTYGQKLQEEIRKKYIGVPGAVAKTFSTEDINGAPFNLADYKGKYVLLDFWASWCLPCRKSNPHLRELYAKYKDKGFEIVGISDDDNKPEAWKKAVEKDSTGIWKHVLRGMKRTDAGIDRSNDKLEFYNVHALPTKILVGPDGKIIGRYEEEGDEPLDKQLAAVLGK
jgi:thiol-disulfide isomerase/thioredoxin